MAHWETHIPPGTNVLRVFFPGRQRTEDEVIRDRPAAAPRQPEAVRAVAGQFIALQNITFAEQANYEKRLRRLEGIENWMANLPVSHIDVEDAYKILDVSIEDEYTSLYEEDYNAYSLMVIRVSAQQLRNTAKLIHPDKMTTDLTLPLQERSCEAMKYAANTMDIIRDAWSVQNIAPVEGLRSYFIIKRGFPLLVLKWRREDSVMVGTMLSITVGGEEEDGAVAFDEQEKEPGVSFAVYTYEEYPSLFDCAHPTVFHLYHVGVTGAQQGMRSPALRHTIECPLKIYEHVQEIEHTKKEADLRARIARARAELKRETEADNHHNKRKRYWEAPWRRSKDWWTPRESCSASSWKAWQSKDRAAQRSGKKSRTRR